MVCKMDKTSMDLLDAEIEIREQKAKIKRLTHAHEKLEEKTRRMISSPNPFKTDEAKTVAYRSHLYYAIRRAKADLQELEQALPWFKVKKEINW